MNGNPIIFLPKSFFSFITISENKFKNVTLIVDFVLLSYSMQSLSFSEYRFVTSGTEQRYYRWRRSVHQTTRPACMAHLDPLWGRSCRDFSTLCDRRGSCRYHGITGACEDACPESPKDHWEKNIYEYLQRKRPTNLHRKNCRLLLQGLHRALTRNEDLAWKRDRFFEMASKEDPSREDHFRDDTFRSPATIRIRKEDVKINAIHDNVIAVTFER